MARETGPSSSMVDIELVEDASRRSLRVDHVSINVEHQHLLRVHRGTRPPGSRHGTQRRDGSCSPVEFHHTGHVSSPSEFTPYGEDIAPAITQSQRVDQGQTNHLANEFGQRAERQ